MVIKQILPVCLLLFVAGCATTDSYQAVSAPQPAKPADYPICVYPRGSQVPRRFEVIGTSQAQGKSIEAAVARFMVTAREKGADAVQVSAVETPTYLNTRYDMGAALIRFTDTWETVPMTEAQFRDHLKADAAKLDPIEGVWAVSDAAHSRIGIIKNTDRGGDFVGFILTTKNPSWQPGYRKLDIRKTPQAAVYELRLFQDDFLAKESAMRLGDVSPDEFYFEREEERQIRFARE